MPLSKIQGIDGQVTPNFGRRNLIINGAMTVNQRGNATGVNTSSYRACDRFKIAYEGTSSVYAVSRDGSAPSGFAHSYKVDTTTADGSQAAQSQVAVLQYIEALSLPHLKYGTSNAESLTLSFYVKSNMTGTYAVNMYSQDGARIIGSTYTINAADTWEKKVITFAGDTGGTINNDTGRGLEVKWFLSAGSTYRGTDNTSWGAYADAKIATGQTVDIATSTSNNWFITGIQLEVGTGATDFEHRSFGEELSLCQRYYQRTQGTSSGYQNLVVLTNYSTGADQRGVIPFVTEMRVGPSISTSGNLMILGAGGSLSSINAGDGLTTHMAGLRVNTTSNLSTGQSTLLRGNNDGTAHLKFDAEL